MPISASSSSLSSAATSLGGAALRRSRSASTWRPARSRSRGPRTDVLDRLAVLAELDVDRDLVAAERVLALGLGVGVLEQPVLARVLVVVEDDLAVQALESRIRSCEHLTDGVRGRRRAGRSPRGSCRGRSSPGSSPRRRACCISGWQQWWPARIATPCRSRICATSCGWMPSTLKVTMPARRSAGGP